MWFKNLSVFRLTEAFTLTPEELEKNSTLYPFAPVAFMKNLHLAGHFP
jgi:Putative exonuclease, RdgC.